MNLEDYINDMNMAEVISGSIKVLIEENEELQQRIDKAIDFINKIVDPEPWSFYKGKAFYDLLEILKGSDKND